MILFYLVIMTKSILSDTTLLIMSSCAMPIYCRNKVNMFQY